MIICKKCGFEISENSRYCSQCGAMLSGGSDMPEPPGAVFSAPENVRYCGKCGAKLPENCAYCLICGVKAGESPVPEPEHEPAAVSPSPAEPAARRHSKKLAVICAIFGIVLALSAATMWLVETLPYFGSAKMTRAKDAVIYVTEGGALKFKTAAMDQPEEIVSGYDSRADMAGSPLAKSGAGGRYIAYLNGYSASGGKPSGRLFLRDFAKKPALDSAEAPDLLIAENVSDEFFFIENGSDLVFLTGTGELYSTDFSRNLLLDSGVDELIGHSESRILYSKSGGGTPGIYLYDADSTVGSIMIDSDVISIADHTPSLDRFVYLRGGSGGSRDIMAFDLKLNSRRTLAVGVGDLLAADARSFTAMYVTESANALRYDNLIDDGLARSDESVIEPNIENYPLLMEFYNKYDVDADLEEDMENYEELAEESAQLQADMEAYDEKLARDAFRAQTREDIDEFVTLHPTLYDLHLTRDGVTTRLAGGSYSPYEGAELDIDNGCAVWPVTSLADVQKASITDHEQAFGGLPALEYLNGALSDDICFFQFDSEPVWLYVGEGSFHSGGWRLTDRADGIYFALGGGGSVSEGACSLYYAPIQSGSAGRIVLIDENVSGIGPMFQGDSLLYYKDSFEDRCDLYITGGGAGERLADNISLLDDYFQIKNDGKTLLYCEHFDPSSKSGNLFMLSKQNRQLATDVYRAFYRNDSLVYFLRGLKDGKAELYSFGSDGLSRVDENVVAVLE